MKRKKVRSQKITQHNLHTSHSVGTAIMRGRYLTFSLAVYANAPYTYRGYTQVKFLGELDERQKWEENFTSE